MRTSSPEATEARQSLDEAIRREAELRAKPALNGVERAELDSLPAFMQQLRNTIVLYERIEQPGPAVVRANDMARQMREKEALFRLMAKREDANTKFYNAQCTNEYSQLEWIDQAERDNQTIQEYDRLGEGLPAPRGATGRSGRASAPAAAASPDDKEQLKEDERALSDPDELARRVEHLRQLSSKGKSK